MFTGLIEEVGTVTRVAEVPHGFRLHVAGDTVTAALRSGDSIAVDGVCLTAVAEEGGELVAEVSPETVARTNIQGYREGTRVNLERPLAAGAPLGGHFVQGHVDGVTRLRSRREEGEFMRIRLDMPAGLEAYLVEKGSVAVNGVSLTVALLLDEAFEVQLVPHTMRHTNLTWQERPEIMNVEVDILGKYVARMLEGRLSADAARALAGGQS